MKYNLIVCGGTFDLLHKGHKKFIKDVLNLSDEVLLGITSNSYISEFKTSDIEDFEIRRNGVIAYLDSINSRERVEIVSIDSAYEPLLESTFKPQVIGVTKETQKTAEEINVKRAVLGLASFKVEVLEMEEAEDGALISSTRIRNGEINRDGRLYVRKFWLNGDLHLPLSLRAVLQKPLGKVLNSVPVSLNPEKTITIGDITTQKFNEENMRQFLSIIDFQVNRQKKFDNLSELGFEENLPTIEVENPAGSIASQLFVGVWKAFKSKEKHVILVKGEEDLAVLPVLLIAPLSFTIFYGQPRLGRVQAGQPDVGLVEVYVTEESKEKAFDLVSKFTS